MKRSWMIKGLASTVLGVLLGAAPSAHACAVCMGGPEAPLTKGMAWGIAALLVIITSVLAGVASFFVYLARKSSATAQTEQPAFDLVANPNKA